MEGHCSTVWANTPYPCSNHTTIHVSPHEEAPQVQGHHRVVGLRHAKVAVAVHHDACSSNMTNMRNKGV